MKKLLLLILAFLPLSAFAGTDTDRICTDTSISYSSKYYGDVFVSYPGEDVSISGVQKYFHLPQDAKSSSGYTELYYMVNIKKKGAFTNDRSELYTYNCETKKASMLLSVPIKGDGGSYYTVEYLNNHNLILAQKSFGAAEGITEYIIGYNVLSQKKFLSIKWTGEEGHIEGFVNTKNFWYLYLPNDSLSVNSPSSLYRIDKKTKKITKL